MKIFGLPLELALLFFVVFICLALAVMGWVAWAIGRYRKGDSNMPCKGKKKK